MVFKNRGNQSSRRKTSRRKGESQQQIQQMEIGTSNMEISKYVSNKTKSTQFFGMVFVTLLVVSVVLCYFCSGSGEKNFSTIHVDRTVSSHFKFAISLSHSPQNLCFTGMRLDMDPGSLPPPQYQIVTMIFVNHEDTFFWKLHNSCLKCLAVSRFLFHSP